MQNRFKKAGEIDYTPQFILVSTCWHSISTAHVSRATFWSAAVLFILS